jgi:inner membrane protein
MDTLTHALSGALLARAMAPRKPDDRAIPLRRRMGVGFLAAAFPDLDVVTSYLSPLSYLYYHRGVTHSILMLPLWALLLSLLFAWLWRDRRGWRAYFGVCAASLAAHIVGDLITSFGTMIFAPFSDARYALSTTFIIDLWFTGVILAGLAACAVWRRSPVAARAGLAALAAYVAFQWAMQQQAIQYGQSYAEAEGIRNARITAVPRPVTPFNWTVFVSEADRYRYAHVNLVRKEARPAPGPGTSFIAGLDAPYRPLDDARWERAALFGSSAREESLAREAYGHPDFAFFRWFAAYPAIVGVEGAGTCVWFEDLRFVTPGRPSTPFRYGMCRDDAQWRPFQLARSGARSPVY